MAGAASPMGGGWSRWPKAPLGSPGSHWRLRWPGGTGTDGRGAAWARVDLAQCLVRSNRYAEAVTVGTQARSAADRLESPALVERAEAVLRMARGRAPDDEPWRPLTSREFEVARLIGEGMTNAEYAEALDIAPRPRAATSSISSPSSGRRDAPRSRPGRAMSRLVRRLCAVRSWSRPRGSRREHRRPCATPRPTRRSGPCPGGSARCARADRTRVGRDGRGQAGRASDLDFSVVVDDGAKTRYLADIDWLEALGPIAFEFPNTVDGRKVLFEDGLYAEYAVFTLPELMDAAYTAARVVWRRLRRPGRAREPEARTPSEIVRNDRVARRRGADQPVRRPPPRPARRAAQRHATDPGACAGPPDLHPGRARTRGGSAPGPLRARTRGGAAAGRVGPAAAGPGPGYEHNREAALAILDAWRGSCRSTPGWRRRSATWRADAQRDIAVVEFGETHLPGGLA